MLKIDIDTPVIDGISNGSATGYSLLDVTPCPDTIAKIDKVQDIFTDTVFDDINQISLVSLFCGAGGLDLGFKQAGFSTSIAFDFNEAAVNSFNNSHLGNVASVVDIEKTGAVGILELVKKKIPLGSEIAVIGGPPCQGFSQANANSTADDPRNLLPKVYLEIVKELMRHYSVNFLLIENVSGIRAAKHSDTLKGIVAEIQKLGFQSHCEQLNSAEHGVAQIRKRMILIGLRKNASLNFKFPDKQKRMLTVRDAIGELPMPTFFKHSLTAESIPYHQNHWTMNPRSKKFSADYVAPPTSRSFKKVQWDMPSKTIAFGNREILVHPSGTRRLSIYEAMLLQGFPKKFKLLGNLSDQVTQVSNAVPPPLAKAIALSLKKAIVASK